MPCGHWDLSLVIWGEVLRLQFLLNLVIMVLEFVELRKAFNFPCVIKTIFLTADSPLNRFSSRGQNAVLKALRNWRKLMSRLSFKEISGWASITQTLLLVLLVLEALSERFHFWFYASWLPELRAWACLTLRTFVSCTHIVLLNVERWLHFCLLFV